MKRIKDASIIFLIVFIIASTLYAIHMFRYELIQPEGEAFIIKYDRIKDDICVIAMNNRKAFPYMHEYGYPRHWSKYTKNFNKKDLYFFDLVACNNEELEKYYIEYPLK